MARARPERPPRGGAVCRLRSAARDVAAFHSQQAAEKLLKGFLVLAGQPVLRTHDLVALAGRVGALFPTVAWLARATEVWTVWSAAYRYPSEDIPESPPPIPELEAALNVIERLADALASLRPE